MTLKEYATKLNNREYKNPQFTDEELQIAKDHNFVIVTGFSDDLVELNGAIKDEADCWEGATIRIKAEKNGKILNSSTKTPNIVRIKINWYKDKDSQGNTISWTYETSVPHESFMIYENGEPYCRGIVFALPEKTYNPNKELIKNTAELVRTHMQHLYGKGTNLCGHCVEASEKIVNILSELGIQAKMINGWCIYEDDSTCTDRCYDEHTWVEADGLYIDVTADQFNPCMIHKLKPVYVCENRLKCMVYEKPDYEWLDEKPI